MSELEVAFVKTYGWYWRIRSVNVWICKFIILSTRHSYSGKGANIWYSVWNRISAWCAPKQWTIYWCGGVIRIKAILLGAGYATHLYPSTKDKAKPLLEVAWKTIITDYFVEKIFQVPKIDEIIIVTNSKFVNQFEEWVEQANYEIKFTVVNDCTLTNENV